MKFKIALSIANILLCASLLTGCKQETDSPTDGGGTSGSGVTFVEQAALPMTGGNVNGIVQRADHSMVAIINNKLYTVSASGGAPELLNSDFHSQIAIAPDGAVYTIVRNNSTGKSIIRRYDMPSANFTDLQFPIDLGSPANFRFATNGEIFIGFPDPRTIYSDMYYSTDQGASWKVIKHLYTEVDAAYTSDGALITVASFPSACYVIKTSDHGVTWDTLSKYGVNELGINLFMRSNGDIFTYMKRGNQLHVSHDGGKHFTKVTWPAENPYIYDIAESGTSIYLLGTGTVTQDSYGTAGVLRSDDGGTTWKSVFLCATATGMSVSGSAIALGSTHGVLYSADAKDWSLIGDVPVVTAADVSVDHNKNMLLTTDGMLFRLNAGKWNVLAAPGSAGKLHRSGASNLYCSNGAAIIHSTDNGSSWQYSKVDLKAFYQWSVAVMGFTTNPAGDVFAAVAEYNPSIDDYASGEMLRSVDAGVTFNSQYAQRNFTSVFSVGNDLLGANQLYIGGHKTDLYLSKDLGKSWALYTGPYPLAVNSQNRLLTYKTADGVVRFNLVDYNSQATKEIKTSIAQNGHVFVRAAKFGPDDRLYLLIQDVVASSYKVYVSEKPVQ